MNIYSTSASTNHMISFPRSGQHMTQRLLHEFHTKHEIPYSYCNFYNCCRSIPCKFNYVYQKNHDDGLAIRINPSEKYLFLYRKNKIEQLEAYYRFFTKTRSNYTNEREYARLFWFCRAKSQYYDRLVAKYRSQKHPNVLCIDYNCFLNDPSGTFHKIITFFGLKISLKQVKNYIENRSEKIYKKNCLPPVLVARLKRDLKFGRR